MFIAPRALVRAAVGRESVRSARARGPAISLTGARNGSPIAAIINGCRYKTGECIVFDVQPLLFDLIGCGLVHVQSWRAGRATARARGFGGRFSDSKQVRSTRVIQKKNKQRLDQVTVVPAGPAQAYLRTAERSRLA